MRGCKTLNNPPSPESLVTGTGYPCLGMAFWQYNKMAVEPIALIGAIIKPKTVTDDEGQRGQHVMYLDNKL